MSRTPFDIDIPLADDAPITSDIHLRAMDDNLLTHAQFPNPQAWEFFREWLTRNTLEHLQHSNKGVLIARHAASGETASFIKWLEYGPGGEAGLPLATTSVEDEWPEFCGRAILEEYTNVAADMRRRALGDKGYFRKFFISAFCLFLAVVFFFFFFFLCNLVVVMAALGQR
jgi:hypothetical protein